ncbi:MAG: hypothetical protein R3D52_12510 [Xanthobacteraceae bacterium]
MSATLPPLSTQAPRTFSSGGEAYEDAILIQANIVTEDDKVQYGDAESLVPEVIAFTDATDSDNDCEPITPTQVDTASADLLGHVMT